MLDTARERNIVQWRGQKSSRSSQRFPVLATLADARGICTSGGTATLQVRAACGKMPHGPSVLYFTSYETHMLLVGQREG